MKFVKEYWVFDAPDLEAESAFWAGMYGGHVEKSDDWHSVIVEGKVKVGVQLAPDHVSPDWPSGQQQAHLDLYVTDIRAAHEAVTALGAGTLQQNYDVDDETGFWVYADPAGHPFCLCW